jgi:hypothetical protein
MFAIEGTASAKKNLKLHREPVGYRPGNLDDFDDHQKKHQQHQDEFNPSLPEKQGFGGNWRMAGWQSIHHFYTSSCRSYTGLDKCLVQLMVGWLAFLTPNS